MANLHGSVRETQAGAPSLGGDEAPARGPQVAVVVPRRSDGGGPRDRIWAWLASRWHTEHPDWQVHVGEHLDGPWCKALAVQGALEGVDNDVLVIADADIWVDPARLRQAVTLTAGGAPWVIPHQQVRRLTEAATAAVLAGDADLAQIATARSALVERPYVGMRGGGLLVIRRQNWENVGGFDPRFAGWGGEDQAFGWAADTLLGRAVRLPGVLWHLWHPPQQRLSRTVGSVASAQLTARYQAARGNPHAMRALITSRRS